VPQPNPAERHFPAYMKLQLKSCRPFAFAALAALALAGESLHAQTTHTWLFTAGGTGFSWNDPNSWVPSEGFPNSPGAIANVNTNILGNQTINLQQPITVGLLNLGDEDGSHTMTIAPGFPGNTLTFDSGDPNVAAELVMSAGVAAGTAANSLAVPMLLNSNLLINLGTSNRTLQVATAGSLDTGMAGGEKAVTLTGGTTGTNQFTLNGDLQGAGTFVNNSNASVIVNGAKTFTGTFVLNKGIGGSNTGSLTLTSGSVAQAAEIVINGYLTNGVTQNGGSLHSGNSAGMGTNPGQRLTQNRITLNGGSLSPAGQVLTGAAIGSLIQDNVAVLDFNSGFSHILMSRGTDSSGTLLNVATMERSFGASAYVRSSTLGLAVDGSQLKVGNANEFLIGANGAEGTTTMSIIPWMGANNSGAGTSVPTGFATYTPTGIRALFTAGEYAGTIGSGSDANVSVNSFTALAAPTAVNSLRFGSTNSVSNIGAGQVLTITSGGLFFAAGGASIGAAGNANAGTLDFGPAEGVVWANATNTNGIGASITGSGGLSKAGTGTLVLTGTANTFTGLVYVGGGTLQVGNGANFSTLGLADGVSIAPGAQLSLVGGDMILDTAFIQLEQYGLFNGKVSLFDGVNETVGALFFGETAMPAGTYGAVGSAAEFQDDSLFGGTGILTVVPEPGSAALLLGGFGMMLMGRRRRA
jgi:autotransporter-associated beta strand protein